MAKNNNIWLVVGVALIVGLIAGIVGANITGNALSVRAAYNPMKVQPVYNMTDINAMFKKGIVEAHQIKFDVYQVNGINFSDVYQMSDVDYPNIWFKVCANKRPGETCDIGSIEILITNVTKIGPIKSVQFETGSYSYPILIPKRGLTTVNVANNDRVAIILDSD